MSEWHTATIAQFCARTTSGGTPSRRRPEFFCEPPDGFPWVRSQELVDRRITSCGEHITGAGLSGSAAKLVPPASVLVAMYGATVGQLAYLDIEAATNQAVCVLITDSAVSDSRFLYYLLMHERPRLVAAAHGAAQQNLSLASIREFEIRVPAIDTQRRIAAVLTAHDDLIENNIRRTQVLEETAREIYQEWFVRFRYPGHESVPLAGSRIGLIPEGWGAGSFGDLVALNTTTVDPRAVDPTTPAVGLEHIPRRRITLDDWGQAGALGSRKTTFVAGDLLFGKIRPYFHKVCLAPVDGLCSTDAIVLRPRAENWGQAILAIASDEFVAHAVQTSNGTKMPRADWKVLREFPVALPPRAIARRFSDSARAVLGQAEALMFQTRSLARLRDLLLPGLVTGKVDVSHLNMEALTKAAFA